MTYEERLEWLRESHRQLIEKKNATIEGNGVYERWENPILTAEHAPLEWRYDFNKERNPYLMGRIGVHATLNSGAIKWNGKYVLVVRVEGNDRKSFFAVAESPNGVDNFSSGPGLLPCRSGENPLPTCMTCDSPPTRTGGFTASSA